MIEVRPAQNVGSALTFVTERVAAPVEAMHRVIAGRWFGPFGAIGAPVRKAHDALTTATYESVRLGVAAVGIGLDELITFESGTVDSVQAFVNGMWGDDLGRHEDRLEITLSIRDRGGAPVTIGPDLARVFPAATDRLVVLVHGLVETERCWHGTETEPGLAEALEDHADLTAVSIRYNSGLRVSENGMRLAMLLEEVHSEWSVPVQSIALIGHSMGGLVVRSACEIARTSGHRWIEDVGDVVTVGAPHHGSPLEKVANVAAWGLGVASETKPLAEFVNERSVGIKDLRFGAIGEDDWRGVDPDALLRNTVRSRPLPPGIDHHFVTGVVTSDPTHPVGNTVGDLVVRPGSGTGDQHHGPRNTVVIGGKNHFGLLHAPAVISRVMDWLLASPVRDRSCAG